MVNIYLGENLKVESQVTRLKLITEAVVLDILHIGIIPSFLNSYFSQKNFQHDPYIGKSDNTELDIILVNIDSPINNKVLKRLDNHKLIVTYTKTLNIRAGSEFIHFSLVPILLNYLAKIKGVVHLLNDKNTTDKTEKFLNKVTQIIDENIDNDTLNMQQLSELLYMSRSCLSKKIKTLTGLKPTAFINQYKLEKSKHLLIVTNWQISRISDALGFCSQQYFCRLFKKQEGMNPTNFRFLKREAI